LKNLIITLQTRLSTKPLQRFFKLYFLLNVGVFCSWSSAQNNNQETWPNRPIRIITTDPGGAADIAARLIAPSLSKSFGQPVYIDNR